MSVDGYGTETDNNAVLNSVTRPLTTLNSGVFALGVAKRPNMERAEPLRKDPVERLMAGLCMRLYLKIFAQPENRRRFSTAHQTFGRNFDGLRLLRPIFLDDTKMRIAMTLTRKNKESPRCWRKTRSSRSHVRAETPKKKNLASRLVNRPSKVSRLFRHMAGGRNHSGSQDFEEIHMRGGDVLTVLCRCNKLRSKINGQTLHYNRITS